MTTHQYGVKAVKPFKTLDGGGYSCNLTRNGKKIAEVFEEGNGGEIQISWVDHKATKVAYESRNYKDEVTSYKGTPEEALFETFIFNQPQVDSPSGLGDAKMYINGHIFIDDLVNDALLEKKVAGELKRKVIVEKSDGVFNFSVKAPQTLQSVMEAVEKKYDDANILNKLTVKEVIEVYKKHNLIG